MKITIFRRRIFSLVKRKRQRKGKDKS